MPEDVYDSIPNKTYQPNLWEDFPIGTVDDDITHIRFTVDRTGMDSTTVATILWVHLWRSEDDGQSWIDSGYMELDGGESWSDADPPVKFADSYWDFSIPVATGRVLKMDAEIFERVKLGLVVNTIIR